MVTFNLYALISLPFYIVTKTVGKVLMRNVSTGTKNFKPGCIYYVFHKASWDHQIQGDLKIQSNTVAF